MRGMLIVMMAAVIILSAGAITCSDEAPTPQPSVGGQTPIKPGTMPGDPGPRMNPGQSPMQVPQNALFMPEPMCPGTVLMRVMMPILAMDPGLRLSQEQMDKLRLVFAKSEVAMAPLREKARKAMTAFRDAILADEYDANKVQELAAASAKAEADIAGAELDQWKQIRSILTTGQIKFMREIVTLGSMPGFPRMIAPTPGGQMMPGPNGPRPGGRPDLYAQ